MDPNIPDESGLPQDQNDRPSRTDTYTNYEDPNLTPEACELVTPFPVELSPIQQPQEVGFTNTNTAETFFSETWNPDIDTHGNKLVSFADEVQTINIQLGEETPTQYPVSLGNPEFQNTYLPISDHQEARHPEITPFTHTIQSGSIQSYHYVPTHYSRSFSCPEDNISFHPPVIDVPQPSTSLRQSFLGTQSRSLPCQYEQEDFLPFATLSQDLDEIQPMDSTPMGIDVSVSEIQESMQIKDYSDVSSSIHGGHEALNLDFHDICTDTSIAEIDKSMQTANSPAKDPPPYFGSESQTADPMLINALPCEEALAELQEKDYAHVLLSLAQSHQKREYAHALLSLTDSTQNIDIDNGSLIPLKTDTHDERDASMDSFDFSGKAYLTEEGGEDSLLMFEFDTPRDTPAGSDAEDDNSQQEFPGTAILGDVIIIESVDSTESEISNEIVDDDDATVFDDTDIGSMEELRHLTVRAALQLKIQGRSSSAGDESDEAEQRRKMRNKEHAKKSRERAKATNRKLSEENMELEEFSHRQDKSIKALESDYITAHTWLQRHHSSHSSDIENIEEHGPSINAQAMTSAPEHEDGRTCLEDCKTLDVSGTETKSTELRHGATESIMIGVHRKDTESESSDSDLSSSPTKMFRSSQSSDISDASVTALQYVKPKGRGSNVSTLSFSPTVKHGQSASGSNSSREQDPASKWDSSDILSTSDSLTSNEQKSSLMGKSHPGMTTDKRYELKNIRILEEGREIRSSLHRHGDPIQNNEKTSHSVEAKDVRETITSTNRFQVDRSSHVKRGPISRKQHILNYLNPDSETCGNTESTKIPEGTIEFHSHASCGEPRDKEIEAGDDVGEGTSRTGKWKRRVGNIDGRQEETTQTKQAEGFKGISSGDNFHQGRPRLVGNRSSVLSQRVQCTSQLRDGHAEDFESNAHGSDSVRHSNKSGHRYYITYNAPYPGKSTVSHRGETSSLKENIVQEGPTSHTHFMSPWEVNPHHDETDEHFHIVCAGGTAMSPPRMESLSLSSPPILSPLSHPFSSSLLLHSPSIISPSSSFPRPYRLLSPPSSSIQSHPSSSILLPPSSILLSPPSTSIQSPSSTSIPSSSTLLSSPFSSPREYSSGEPSSPNEDNNTNPTSSSFFPATHTE